jgi:hypothetical protein
MHPTSRVFGTRRPSEQFLSIAFRDKSCFRFTAAALREGRLAVLEQHDVPAGTDLFIVAEFAGLSASSAVSQLPGE